jgi:hypothetical protein
VVPPSFETTTAAGSAEGSLAERSYPTAMHEVVDGQETPSKPTADEGTIREVQVCPPSLVVRSSRLMPPLPPMPPPATAHWVALPHEMAFSMVVPGGRAWLVHEAPRSELDKITPDGEPSGGVALPTRWQCVSEGHVRPLKYGMPRGAVLSVAIERCFQVDPALVVVMMLRRLPPLGSPMVASICPSAMQDRRVVQVTKFSCSSLLGTTTVLQLLPASFEVTAIALLIAVFTPTAMQKNLVGHEIPTSLPTPFGNVGSNDHELPPLRVLSTAPRSPLP